MKKRNKKLFLLAGTLCLAAPGGWAADGAAAIPYEKLAHLRDGFEALPVAARDKVAMRIVVHHDDQADRSPIHMWVSPAGQRIDIPVAADGAIALPERPDWAAQHVIVQTDQPKGSLGIASSFELVAPPGRVIDLAYLRDGLREINAVLRAGARKYGGYFAQYLVPTVRGLDITLPGCCTGTATLLRAGDETSLRQEQSGAIKISRDVLDGNDSGTITLSARPTKMDPTTD